GRLGCVPPPLSCADEESRPGCARLVFGGRSVRGTDRVDDVLIARTPAEIALEPRADPLLARMPLTLKQLQRAHHHAWSAETTLQGVVAVKRRQQRMLRVALLAQALDRVNRRAIRLDGQDRTRLHGVAVQAPGARAALGGVASDVRTGDAEILPQQVNEQFSGLDLGRPLFTVHRDGDVMS